MNFKFFGDSWYWTWYCDSEKGNENYNFCQSKSMENIDKYVSGLSLISMLIEKMGHTVTNYAKPGSGFRHTRLSYESNGYNFIETDAVNIIFVSSNLRGFKFKDGKYTEKYEVDLSSVDNFLTSYDNIMIADLRKLMQFNKPTDTYLLVSGQENLPAHIFEKAKKDVEEMRGIELTNWHLLSECILVDLACAYNGDAYPYKDKQEQRDFLMAKTPRFGLCRSSEIGLHLTDDKDIGEDLVTMIEEHNEIFRSFWNNGSIYHSAILMTPDPSHLGFTGQIYFVDFVMKFLEDKGILQT